MEVAMRKSIGVVVWMLGGWAVSAHAQGGFTVDADQVPWPKLQARIGLATSPGPLTPLLTDLTLAPGASAVQGGRVLGDYYFLGGGLSLGSARINGGFRATSGVLLGSHGASFSMPTVPRQGLALSASHQIVPLGSSLVDLNPDASHTVPYLGVGYTGLSAKGSWGFTADLGLMALNPGSTSNLARQSLDDTLRDMRITPVVQLGVSYSF
jgi:hypothetical protein